MKKILKKTLIATLSAIIALGTAVPAFATNFTNEEMKQIREELKKGYYTEYNEGEVTKEMIPDDIFRKRVNWYTERNRFPHRDPSTNVNADRIMALSTRFTYPEGMKSIEGYKSVLDRTYLNENYETEFSDLTKKYCSERPDKYSYDMILPDSVEGILDVSNTRVARLITQGKITEVNCKGCYVLKELTLGSEENRLTKLPDVSDCTYLEYIKIFSDQYNPEFLANKPSLNSLKIVKLIGKSTKDIKLDDLSNLEQVWLTTDDANLVDLSDTTPLKVVFVSSTRNATEKVKEIRVPEYNGDLMLQYLDVQGNSLAKIDLSKVIFGFNGEGPMTWDIDPVTGLVIVVPKLGKQYVEEQYEYYIQDGKYVLDLKPILGERRYLDKVKVLNQHDGRYGAKYDKEKGLLIYDKLPEPGNINNDYMGYTLMCPDKTQKEWPMYVNFTNLKEGKAPYVSSIRDEATGIELKGEGLKSDMSLNVTPKKDMEAEDVKAAQKAIVKGVPTGYGIFNMYDIKLMQNGEEIKLKQPTVLTIPIADGMNNKVIAVKDYDSDDSVYPSRFITGDTKLGNSNKNYGHTVKDGKVEMTVERLGVIGLIGSEKDVEEAQKEETDKNLNGAKALKLAEINKLTLGETKGYTEESVKKAEAKLESMKQEAKSNVAKAKTVVEVEAVKLPDVKAARDLLETEEEAERKLQEIKENAKKQLNEVDKTLYREAEQKKITEIVGSALEKINKADSKEDVENSLSDALKKIDSLKTAAQYELEEAKEAKIAEITNATLGDTKGYTAESVKKAEAKLAELKADLIEKVKAAKNIDEINALKISSIVSEAEKLLVSASGGSGSSDKTDKPSTNANADAKADAKSPATADDSNMLVLISTAVTALIAGLFATMIKRKNH